jgi:multicomponent Na+:H+ antiporter subunit F
MSIAGAAVVALGMLALALALAMWRLLRGPSLPDRVVALDLMTSIALGMLAAISIAADQAALLDAAVVLSLVTFLGTVAFARYLEKGGTDD